MKTIDKLERLYKAFFEKQNEGQFWTGFIDYMDFIYKDMGLKNLIEEQLKIQKKLSIVLDNYEFEAMSEFEEIYGKFQKELKTLKLLEDPNIKFLTENIQKYKDGQIHASIPLLSSHYCNFVEIVEYVLKQGHKKVVEKYASLQEYNGGFLLRKINAPKLEAWQDELKNYNVKFRADLYGSVYRVFELYLLALQGKEKKLLEVKDGQILEREISNNRLLVHLVGHEFDKLFDTNNREGNFHFSKVKSKDDIERFNNYLAVNFEEITDEKNMTEKVSKPQDLEEEISMTFEFDDTKSVLFVRGKKIDIKEYSIIYLTLKAMQELGVKNKIPFYEIADKIDPVKYQDTTPIYNALRQLNGRLESLGFKDVFLTTIQNVLVNSRYL